MEHSSKGLFDTPGNGRSFHRKRKKLGALDQFAEHLSRGGEPGDIAVAMGLKRAQGPIMFGRICRRLGKRQCQ